MADLLQVVVRFLHILFAAVWVGGALFSMHAVGGALRRLPPTVAGPAMSAISRKTLTLFAVAGPATVAFGLWNQYLLTGRLRFEGDLWSLLMGTSLVLSLGMLAIGFGNNAPAFRKLETVVQAGGGATPEAARLQKRLMVGGLSFVLLGVTVLALMVVAVARRSGFA